ncbi:MAG: S9 family peptidase [Chlorobi bacterium]|nr:S9 family peptidase [Chlorobiota bacterium]
MNRKVLVFLLVVFPFAGLAQENKKNISFDDIFRNYSFFSKGVNGLKSMNDGLHYTTLENGSRIVKYEYATGKETGTIVDLEELKECPIESIQGYEFNNGETMVLVYTNRKGIYRHSFTADYYVIDIARKEISELMEGGGQMVASFSPDGDKVAFVKNNNIYLKKLRFNTVSAITKDGKKNKILNGIPDWVYEEEFSFNKAYEWSPDSKEIAYIKFDESKVKEYSFPLYEASHPKMTEYSLYPGQYKYKYPKAGEDNSAVSVHVFNVKNRTTKKMDTGNETDIYIPRIRWAMQPERLGIIKLNRHQNQLDLIVANTASTVCRTVFTDRNEYYVDESVLDNLQFTADGKYFIYVGEMDGWNHIYLYTMAGKKVAQVTKGNWDVTDFYGYEPKKKMFYYQSAETSPLRRNVYSISVDGKKKKRLTPENGTNSASFSKGFKYFINSFSNTTTPKVVALYKNDGKQIRVLEDNAKLKERVKQYRISPKEFFTFKTSEGTELNGWMVKPLDFDPSKKYPVLITQYSGPNSQTVRDSWNVGWEQLLAEKGYVVVSVDPRGTGARGEEFRKCTYMKLGKYESDDMIEAAKYLGSLDYVDASRIGIYGWSFGGFMSALCLSKSDVFKIGIAVAPVTNWRYYDTVYTERYMRKPQENPKGYDENSPLDLAENLHGRLFLIHGTADDNVHFQNSAEYIDRLVQAGKQFDLFVYPNRNHSIYGGNTRAHLFRMKLDFIFSNL